MNTLRHTFLLLFSLSVLHLSAQIYEQDFTNGIPSNWVTITQAGFDFVSAFNGEASLFKQSDGDEVLLVGTESLDLSVYTKWEVDLYAYNLAFTSDTKPDIFFGILTDPSDIGSFQPFHVENVDNEVAETFEIYIGGLSGQGHLCLLMVGEKSNITYFDNWKMYDDDFQQNTPWAVANLTATPGTSGGSDVTMNFTSPNVDVDGDALTELTSVDFYFNGLLLHSFDSPTIGGDESVTFDVPAPGYYKFEVIPVNSAGNGNSVFTETFWAGLDFPAEPLNIQIGHVGADVTMNWSTPTVGANGAFFDGVIASYTITRSDGTVYMLPGDAITFSETLDILGTIEYAVVANNTAGAGLPGISPAIHYDSDDYLLYEDAWVDVVQSPADPPLGYSFFWQTTTTNQNAYWSHFYSNLAGGDAGEFSLLWAGAGSPDDEVRLISPKMNTTGLPAVIVEYIHSNDWNAGAQPYQFALETTSDGVTWNVVEEITIDGILQEDVIRSISNSDVGSPDFQIALTMRGNASSPYFLRIDNMRVYYSPSTDVAIKNFAAPATIQPNDALPLSADIVNNSTTDVGCTARCQIKERFGGSAVVFSSEIAVANMGVGEVLNIGFDEWTAVEGEYIIEVSVENPDDENTANNVHTQHLNVFKLQPRSHVIIEEFTGTWCSGCPGAALGIEDLYNFGRPVAAIAYHRSDPYETPEVQERMDVYGVWGFPWVNFDGIRTVTGGHQTLSVVNLYLPEVDAREATDSPVEIDFNYSEFNGTDYSAQVILKSETAIQNPHLQVVAVVTESEIPEDWLGLTKVDYVDRYYASQSVDLSSNFHSANFQFDIEGFINPDHAELVVFVQDTLSKEIWNGTSIDLNTIIDDTNEELYRPDFSIYPNPASDALFVKFDLHRAVEDFSVALMDGLGRVVAVQEVDYAEREQFVKFDVSGLAEGVYFVRMEVDGVVGMKKVGVVR